MFDRPAALGRSLALLVVRGGEVIAEWYGTQPANEFQPSEPVGPDTPLISWSMAKSITHAAVAMLVDDGVLDLEAPAPVPAWAGTPKEEIRLIDLLEMRSGLRFVEDYVDGRSSHCIDMLFGDGADDHAAYAAALPLDHPPGTVWNYSSGTTNIIARIVGDVVGGGEAGMRSFLADRLFGPAGMPSAEPRFDAAGTWVGSSYVFATARDFARFGELYLHDGTSTDGGCCPPDGPTTPGPDRRRPRERARLRSALVDVARPPRSLVAHGYEGQYVVVIPDDEFVLVHLGKTPAEVRSALLDGLRRVIAAAVR